MGNGFIAFLNISLKSLMMVIEIADRKTAVKKMAELLRSGAVMLDKTCPICGLPLFKLKDGEIVCPIHGPVKVVTTESEAVSVMTDAILDELEKVIASEINKAIKEISLGDLSLEEISGKLKSFLELLELIRKIKSLSGGIKPSGKVRR